MRAVWRDARRHAALRDVRGGTGVRRSVSRQGASWGSMLDIMDPVQGGLEDALSAFVGEHRYCGI